jgi:deazaflavin-dependent oxidoreductase (nitroreductase family)
MSFSLPEGYRPVSDKIIEEFRANGGRVGGRFEGAPLALLTTVGARTGRRRTTPVAYLRDGDRVIVFATNAGAPAHPAWYHNLVAHPEVTVEIGTETHTATARPLEGEERDRLYARQAGLSPAFAAYEAATERVIPVIALEPSARTRALGDELVRIHHNLRRELAALLGEVETGHGPSLREHCLTVCADLHGHHRNENDRGFPLLERRFPDLAPLLERFRREHEALDRLRERFERTLAGPGPSLTELRRLAAEMEAHFDREEEQLVPVLNAL